MNWRQLLWDGLRALAFALSIACALLWTHYTFGWPG